MPSLDSLNRGFRSTYFDHEGITAQLRTWADAYPSLARLESIGKTPEGRDLWVLTIGPEPDRARPAVWIDGNMHASELCGSSVALAMAEDFLRLHLEPEATVHDLPAHVRDRLRGVLVHVMPRISPDGAEVVLKQGRYVRSVPRDERPARGRARWRVGDVDGDGVAMLMRIEDPTGELVESKDFPGLLVPRRLEDPPPYYKAYPEGTIENFDGTTIPYPDFLSDNQTDLNRNFPWFWKPEPEQVGAGAFPGAEPESRAVIEYTTARPHLFAWLNLHTFGGVLIRPLGHAPDEKMDPYDLAVFRQIEEWTEKYTGYPTVSGFHEFLYEPDKPLHGDLSDYAYHQRGCVAYVIELWDLFAQAGIAKKKKFVDTYSHLTHDELVQIAKWDRDHNQSRCVRPWRKVQHPQLGWVECGGIDIRVGFSNPPYEKLAEVCTTQSQAFLRVAAMTPEVRVTRVERTAVGSGATRIDVTVQNHGYLPSYGLGSAKKLVWNEPLYARVETHGCSLARPEDALVQLGHLEGWGRGRFDGQGVPYYTRSGGSGGEKTFRVVVQGAGDVTLTIGSCRVGFQTKKVEVG